MTTENVLGIGFTVIKILAWITHVVKCLITAKYTLLFVGSFIFPIGVIHGLGIWVGMAW